MFQYLFIFIFFPCKTEIEKLEDGDGHWRFEMYFKLWTHSTSRLNKIKEGASSDDYDNALW
jgi:hypothetical protein